MKKYKIFIDPGHGGTDPGAVANGLVEKELNLVVSLKLKELLLGAGFEVKLSRETDIFVGLSERARMSNEWGADYFISIHHNAGGGNGWEIIHSVNPNTKGIRLAEAIGKEFTVAGQRKRRIFSRESERHLGRDFFTVIGSTNMPAIITEYAFIDSEDKINVDTAEKLHIEARAIYKGICNYLQISEESIKIRVNGEIINDKIDVQPYIKDGRVMVPIRFVVEALGLNVEWDEESKMVDIHIKI